jgi:hypothetical protein
MSGDRMPTSDTACGDGKLRTDDGGDRSGCIAFMDVGMRDDMERCRRLTSKPLPSSPSMRGLGNPKTKRGCDAIP